MREGGNMSEINSPFELKLSCPSSPNCVSSVAKKESQFVAPIPYKISKSRAKEHLLEMIRLNPHAKLIKNKDDYLHATFTTKFFQFIDDVEFIFDDAQKQIHFRSKSRIGYYDFGANRKRMLAIKKILEPKLKVRSSQS